MKTKILIHAIDNFSQLTNQLNKFSFIKKMPNGMYKVISQRGKNLGIFKSLRAAKKRLKQVEYFKYLDSKKIKKSASKELDLSKIEDFSYSSIMRQINKQLDSSACKHFAELYKKEFDKGYVNNIKNSEKHALDFAIKQFNKTYKVKSDMSNAQI